VHPVPRLLQIGGLSAITGSSGAKRCEQLRNCGTLGIKRAVNLEPWGICPTVHVLETRAGEVGPGMRYRNDIIGRADFFEQPQKCIERTVFRWWIFNQSTLMIACCRRNESVGMHPRALL